ncbi:MAG: tryptophan--tRNA ligase [Rhodospirillales bacterium]|nr:tryptophan--tRNA ligase [Rhodospirillales bacterium]
MGRIFSGIQPTNRLHLGNYLGALKNWVTMQRTTEHDCIFCVVDLHAITVPQDPAQLAQSTREMAAAYIAAGIDPVKSIVFPQSAVPEHSQLMWLLSTITQIGKLDRMTQFKDKAGKNAEKTGLGLYAYPVLMAADILLYKATHVPVGEDQKQHVELAREIVGTFTHRFGELFPEPEPIIRAQGARIMSLRDGSAKMSKSAESDMSRINMTDDADLIAQKFKKAKTDADSVPSSVEEWEGRPEAKNLLTIYAELAEEPMETVFRQFGGQQFSALKTALADLAVEKLAPISQEMNRLMNDVTEIDRILKDGAQRAREIATPVLKDVQDRMGFLRL